MPGPAAAGGRFSRAELELRAACETVTRDKKALHLNDPLELTVSPMSDIPRHSSFKTDLHTAATRRSAHGCLGLGPARPVTEMLGRGLNSPIVRSVELQLGSVQTHPPLAEPDSDITPAIPSHLQSVHWQSPSLSPRPGCNTMRHWHFASAGTVAVDVDHATAIDRRRQVGLRPGQV